MKGKILNCAIVVGYLGMAGILGRLNSLPENGVVKRDSFGNPVFPPTVLMDTNRDGECDKTRTFLMGNRKPQIIYFNPNEEEKELYRQYKTGDKK